MKKNKLRANDNPDPTKYVIVHSKEGDYLRARRTDGVINAQFAAMATETCSAAAKQILTKLKPFTQKMAGRMNVRLSGRMRSAKKQTGTYNYNLMKDFELQKDHPLAALYKEHCTVANINGKLNITVPVTPGCVQQLNSQVTAYYFEAVLLTGDAMLPNSLRVEEEISELFYFDKQYNTTVGFQFIPAEDVPYLLWLKVGCLEGDEPAYHPRHYGMRVIAVGL